MVKSELIMANSCVVCSCGEKHRIIPGSIASVYWCGNRFLFLEENDEIEYEEVSSAK